MARKPGCVNQQLPAGMLLAHTFQLLKEQHVPPGFLSCRGAFGSSSLSLLIAVLSPLIELIVFIALFVFGCHWRGGGKMIARLCCTA